MQSLARKLDAKFTLMKTPKKKFLCLASATHRRDKMVGKHGGVPIHLTTGHYSFKKNYSKGPLEMKILGSLLNVHKIYAVQSH